MDLVLRELFPKRYPVISPSLMKCKWGDPSKFQFNLTFDLEFINPDYEHHTTLLDRISDLDVLFGDDPLKPEWPLSKRFKHCAYAEEVTSVGFHFERCGQPQIVCTYHYLARERESWVWCDPVQYRSQYTLGCEELQLMSHEPFGCKSKWSCTSWSPTSHSTIHLLTHSLLTSLTALLMCP